MYAVKLSVKGDARVPEELQSLETTPAMVTIPTDA